ncbi:hypothetical protein LZD49_10080 [Dyadobacter sp. CY261]|uniref:hypothetical protein n=1 Tax=Dyadobacter sp. CY261 TaxID=2907203 RepID=UPI001F45F5E9|nr:hypothetical protein [Dyadobacter sp. CY261]MCF0070820.1 hypothetical protein [Dyadobacter sp. CY261]
MMEYFYSKFNRNDWSWREPLANVPTDMRELLIKLNNSLKSKESATKLLYLPSETGIFLILDKGNTDFDKNNRLFSFRQFLYFKNEYILGETRLGNLFNQLLPVIDIANPEEKREFKSLKRNVRYSKIDTKKIFEIIISKLVSGGKICIVNERIPASMTDDLYNSLTFATFPNFGELSMAFDLFPKEILLSIPFMLNYEDDYINDENRSIQLIYCGSQPLVPESYRSFNRTVINFNNLQKEGYEVTFLGDFHLGSTNFGELFDLADALKGDQGGLLFRDTLLNCDSTYEKLTLKGKIVRFANLVYLYHRKEKTYTGDFELFSAISHSSYPDKVTLLTQHLFSIALDEFIARVDEYDQICVGHKLLDEVPYILRKRLGEVTLPERDLLIARIPSPEKSEVIKSVLINGIQDWITTWEDLITLSNCETLRPLILALSRTTHLKAFAGQVSDFWKNFAADDFHAISISHLPAIRYLYELTPKNPIYPHLLLARFREDGDGGWLEAADQDAITLPFKLPLENDAGFAERIELIGKIDPKYSTLSLVKELGNQLLAYLPQTSVARKYTRFLRILHQHPVANRPPDGPDNDEPLSARGVKPVEVVSGTDSTDGSEYAEEDSNSYRPTEPVGIYAWMTRSIPVRVYHIFLAISVSLFFVFISWLWISGTNTTSSQSIPPAAVQPQKPTPIDSVARAIAEAESFLNRMYFQGDTALNPANFQARANFRGIQFALVKNKARPSSRIEVKKVDSLPNDIWWNRFVKLYRDSVVVIQVIAADSDRIETVTRLKIENKTSKKPTYK